MKMKWFGIKANSNGDLRNSNVEFDDPGDLQVQYAPNTDEILIMVYSMSEPQALAIATDIYRNYKKVWGKNLTWKNEVV